MKKTNIPLRVSLFLIVMGLVWMVAGLLFAPTHPLSAYAPAVVIALALLFVLYNRKDLLWMELPDDENDTSPEAARWRRKRRGWRYITAGEFALVAAAVWLVNARQRADFLLAAIALVVGVYFLALAGVFKGTRYLAWRFLIEGLVMISLVGFVVLGITSPWRNAVVGTVMAAILWASALLNLFVRAASETSPSRSFDATMSFLTRGKAFVMWIVHGAGARGVIGLVTGVTLLLSNVCFATPWIGVQFMTRVQAAVCPVGTVRTAHCFRITGQAIGMSRAYWRTLDRLAIMGLDSAITVPPHCIPATTRGRLTGSVGTVRFSGSGYFCPQIDQAEFQYRLIDLKHTVNGLARRGSIIYEGHSNIESFVPPDAAPVPIVPESGDD